MFEEGEGGDLHGIIVEWRMFLILVMLFENDLRIRQEKHSFFTIHFFGSFFTIHFFGWDGGDITS